MLSMNFLTDVEQLFSFFPPIRIADYVDSDGFFRRYSEKLLNDVYQASILESDIAI